MCTDYANPYTEVGYSCCDCSTKHVVICYSYEAPSLQFQKSIRRSKLFLLNISNKSYVIRDFPSLLQVSISTSAGILNTIQYEVTCSSCAF